MYNSSFHGKVLFQSEVVNNRKNLQCTKRTLYSYMVKSVTAVNPAKCKPAFKTNTEDILKVPNIDIVHNVSKLSNK